MGINGKEYGTVSPTIDEPVKVKESKDPSSTLKIAKIFGYMFAGLAITAGVAFLFGWIFTMALQSGGKSAYNGIQIGMIICAIALIIMTFVIQLVLLKGKHSILVPAIIYTVLMGLLMSTMTIFIDWRILGIAFGITCGIFGIMWLLAVLLGDKASTLGLVGSFILIGGCIVGLVTWIVAAFAGLSSTMVTMLWVIDFVVFGAVIFITIFDLANIKKICDRGEMTTNLSLYCAFTIYVDFIYIFIRIVYYLGLASRR